MKQDNKFSWDGPKDQSNLIKHGINFKYAAYVFTDEYRMQSEDNRKNYGENRYKVVGNIEGRIITVIYTLRKGNHRIISARRARKDEKEDYLLYIKTRQQTQTGQD